ncbi:MAG: glycosyltransferase [Planctomycetota bacterium]
MQDALILKVHRRRRAAKQSAAVEQKELTPAASASAITAQSASVTKEEHALTAGIATKTITPQPQDASSLRRCAWEIGERHAVATFMPTTNHVALTYVSPTQGFAHWRILSAWVDQLSQQRGEVWRQCRMILRLYDVSCIEFNGFNAHRIQDAPINKLAGQCFFNLPQAGSFQLAEVGFLLRSGEFIPAARAQGAQFPPAGVCRHNSQAALLVDDRLHIEEVASIWEQELFLENKRQPKVRKGLRIATFAFEAQSLGGQGLLSQFVSQLAIGQQALEQTVHVFLPQSEQFMADREVAGVLYHPLKVQFCADPIETAQNFAKVAESRMRELPPFDLFHLHEWMTGLGPWLNAKPTVLSITSTESTRLNGAPPSTLSLEIKKIERNLLHAMKCVLSPTWLREKVISEFEIDTARLHAFPMEGRILNEWEAPLDLGKVKMEFGCEPLDRLLVFAGPLEYAAGPDILVNALPVVLKRVPNARVAFAGDGAMRDQLRHQADKLGVAHAIRLLGHVNGCVLPRLLRASEAVVLPSRQRVEFDEAMVELARRAGRPVVITHGGPARLVRHEETGLVTYDNAGSMVWALDRILGDSNNTERMGRAGKKSGTNACSWQDVSRLYLELCAACFPELT